MIDFIIIDDSKEDASPVKCTFFHSILLGWIGVTKSIIFTKIEGINN